MFKKPPAELKTSAPLRGSDRRQLKQRVLQAFPALQAEEGDILVPDGLLSQKFSTHLDEPGVVYLSPEGDPLWFTIGKGSHDLIPTVYTLWKRPDLLPVLSTPAAVVPKLIGGADLMIPGVVQRSSGLAAGQLVAITRYWPRARGPPLAVGHMAVGAETLVEAEGSDIKGKAVLVLHTWRDTLWDMGPSKRADVPEPRPVPDTEHSDGTESEGQAGDPPDEDTGVVDATDAAPNPPAPGSSASTNRPPPGVPVLTPEDVSHCFRQSLLQALSTTLSNLPPATLPIPASTFWSSYVLPARPAHALGTRGLADASEIDIKLSTHKSVKIFLKACAKEGLIKLKDAKGGDVLVAAVFPAHPAVAEHRPHRSVKDVDAKQQRAEEREKKEKEAEERRRGEIQVTEYWMPHGSTIPWIVAAGHETSCTLAELKTLLNEYVAAKNLVNARDQQYINVGDDEALLGAVVNKNELGLEFLKREEVLGRLREHMQPWYELRVEGRDVLKKKGTLKPIQVNVKLRQGRKACTLVTGFEPFFLDADELAEELRRVCASSTSVAPVAGKPSQLEVMVQGKQIKAVTEMLVAKGVPRQWVTGANLPGEKKKK